MTDQEKINYLTNVIDNCEFEKQNLQRMMCQEEDEEMFIYYTVIFTELCQKQLSAQNNLSVLLST